MKDLFRLVLDIACSGRGSIVLKGMVGLIHALFTVRNYKEKNPGTKPTFSFH